MAKNSIKDFKGSSRAFKGCKLSYQKSIYDKDDMELVISHSDFDATITKNEDEKFILCYSTDEVEDSIEIKSFSEAMQFLKKELVK